jgi:hypothetical protein
MISRQDGVLVPNQRSAPAVDGSASARAAKSSSRFCESSGSARRSL